DDEDQATKEGRGVESRLGAESACSKCVRSSSMAIIVNNCHQSGTISTPIRHH
ncbi:hypothetical protein K443DRAFT_117466, partial [Laccaria amethystina LaAM-08-1]